MALIDLTAAVFGKLRVVSREENSKDGSARWRCLCECGEQRIVVGTSLRAGRHKSCGCSSPRFTSQRSLTHGASKTRTYRIWLGMHSRCGDRAKGKSRRNYYSKGIRVCERWGDFDAFLADMGAAPDGLTLDRINGAGNYEPTNCRWATAKQQANNTSANRLVELRGVVGTLAQVAEDCGLNPNTMLYRLRRGWSVERAALPPGSTNVRTAEKERRARPCAQCGCRFIPRTAQLRKGGGRFCSQRCNGAARIAARHA